MYVLSGAVRQGTISKCLHLPQIQVLIRAQYTVSATGAYLGCSIFAWQRTGKLTWMPNTFIACNTTDKVNELEAMWIERIEALEKVDAEAKSTLGEIKKLREMCRFTLDEEWQWPDLDIDFRQMSKGSIVVTRGRLVKADFGRRVHRSHRVRVRAVESGIDIGGLGYWES